MTIFGSQKILTYFVVAEDARTLEFCYSALIQWGKKVVFMYFTFLPQPLSFQRLLTNYADKKIHFEGTFEKYPENFNTNKFKMNLYIPICPILFLVMKPEQNYFWGPKVEMATWVLLRLDKATWAV